MLRRHRQGRLRALRCEANLRTSPGKTPPSRKRTKRTQTTQDLKKQKKVEPNALEEKLHEVTDSSDEDEYERDGSYARIRKQQAVALAATVEKRVRNPRVYSAMRDLWAECKGENGRVPNTSYSSSPPATEPRDIPDDHYLRVTRKKPVQVRTPALPAEVRSLLSLSLFPQKPHSMKEKPSLVMSVEPPPPGTSYNPTFEDHQVPLVAMDPSHCGVVC